jgi:hypothetical protein
MNEESIIERDYMYLIQGSEATDFGQESCGPNNGKRIDTDMLLFPTHESAIAHLKAIGYIREETLDSDMEPPSTLVGSYWVDTSRNARVDEDGLPVLVSKDEWKLIGIYKVDCKND